MACLQKTSGSWEPADEAPVGADGRGWGVAAIARAGSSTPPPRAPAGRAWGAAAHRELLALHALLAIVRAHGGLVAADGWSAVLSVVIALGELEVRREEQRRRERGELKREGESLSFLKSGGERAGERVSERASG